VGYNPDRFKSVCDGFLMHCTTEVCLSRHATSLRWLLPLLAVSAAAFAAEPFPPVTDAERALTSVPGSPNAAAVVLWRQGELRMMDPGADVSSHLVVRGRLKILKPEGAGHGDIVIAHGAYVRLNSFEGRTVLPDGRIVPVPKDVRFERTASRSKRLFVTSVPFPAVEPGAVLDYRFEVSWDSIFFLEPWFFQESDIPVLHSEINFDIPSSVHAYAWSRDPMRVGIKSEKGHTVRGPKFRAWADNLPEVPNEPEQPPFGDMAAQLMMIPTEYSFMGEKQKLMESWPATCELFVNHYDEARKHDGELGSRVKTLVAGAATEREKAVAIYRFVRDEIGNETDHGVGLREQVTLGSVLKNRRGSSAEKALLLDAMLREAKLESKILWVADRDGGAIDLNMPNPAWFDGMAVVLTLDGRQIVLDPTDRALAFGHLRYGLEGTTAVEWDVKKPMAVALPEAGYTENSTRAAIELAVDDSGRTAGKGVLTLAGMPAWRRTLWKDDAAQTVDAWKKELEDELPGFVVHDVAVEEKVEDQTVVVRWNVAQKDEEVLGNELTLSPSRPLGPARQLFPATPPRRTAIELDYARRGDVELRLRWPAGWKPQALPQSRSFANAAGVFSLAATPDADGLGLVYTRRFDVARRLAVNKEQIEQTRVLYQQATDGDAQAIVLAHR
jgi:hypothetical protein